MINPTLATIAQVSVLAYVVAGMTAMGLTLTVKGIVRPLRDARLVLGVLVANFVVVPAVAVLATRCWGWTTPPPQPSSCSAAPLGHRSSPHW
jgi:BASS family bile acid:Na+ symporter